MWYRNKFFQYGAGIIVILLVIFLTGKVEYFFGFILKVLAALAKPVLLAGLFYYLFRPLVSWMELIRIPKVVAILFTYLLFGGLVALFLIYAGTL
ncbi:MAG TPA: AI-2E family transporter, partial [Bacillota bacterium]|nr:AI-2E family transporter [Bacillota bacterium]